MLNSSQSDPLFITPETDMEEMNKHYHRLLDVARSSSLNELELDHDVDSSKSKFKCLSAAIYCLTRHVPTGCETEYFKKILMDIVMQGGEASTNAAVSGALLGARFGYSQLPTDQIVGMLRWEWLEDKIDEFCNLF
jgi:ADP-ribosylglycohydrolase